MEDTDPTQEVKLVYRRLDEVVKIGGHEYDPQVFWPAVLVAVLAVALLYVVWMYKRDSRTVGWKWATFLGVLRCSVYAILAWVFLLPAEEIWDKIEQHSKVIFGLDVSGSMSTRDDVPTPEVPVAKLPTRLDKLVGLFSGNEFLPAVLERNPAALYRIGGASDDTPWVIRGDDFSAEELSDWLHLRGGAEPQGDDKSTEEAQRKLEDLHRRLRSNTNYGEALLRITNREFNNLVQAIIVFGDGRNTQGSDQTLRELRARAGKAKIPIIAVAVGDARPPINIHITDLQTPEQARPDDKFPVRIEIDGQGLPNQETEVTLEITSPSGKKFTEKRPFKFDGGSNGLPHAQIEFEMDSAKYGIVGDDKKQTLEEGKWLFKARIPRDRREVFDKDFHVSKEETVLVQKKPLRVLLFAEAATRDFQFLRTLFVREVDQRRAELSICLQTQRPGLVQDVPADRLLRHFPTRLGNDPAEKPEERYYNLAQYDLIVAFDPDWTQLTPEQLNLLEQWVRRQAGGLVLVAGPIHTTKMARPGPVREQLRQLLDMYPVELKDSTLIGLGIADKGRSQPHRLLFPPPSPDLEFLKLDDDGKDLLAGWEEFFTGKVKAEVPDPTVERGFFSYYPVKTLKPSAVAVANYGDPSANLDDGRPQPWLVTMPYERGRVVYLSSGETYRLRTYKEAFHERFWTKLGRYAGSGTLSQLSRHGVLVMGREFTAGQMVRLEAQLFGRDLQPLNPNATPRLEVKPKAGVAKPTTHTLRQKPSASTEWNGWFQAAFRVTQPGDYDLELHIPETGDVLQGKFTVRESDPEMDNTQPDFNFLYQLASPASEVDGRLDDTAQRKFEDTLRATAARLVGLQDDSRAADPGKGRDSVRLFFDLESADLIPQVLGTDSRTQSNKGHMDDLWDRGWIFTKEELQAFASKFQQLLAFGTIVMLLAVGGAWLLDKPLRNLLLIAGSLLLFQVPVAIVTSLAKWRADIVFPSGMTEAGNIVPVAGPADTRVLIVSYVLVAVVALLSLEWLTRKLLKLA